MFQFAALSSAYLPYILAGLLVLCTIFVKHHFFNTSGKRRSLGSDHPVIVLSGPMSSGKTKLWSRLINDCDSIETIPSVVSHSAIVRGPVAALIETESDVPAGRQRRSVTPESVTLVDTPAHARLRAAALATHLVDATNVVFGIDSKDGLSGKGLRDTAESLDLVLSYLLLLSYQRPKGNLPKLAIYLSSSSTFPQSSQTNLIETCTKIKTTLNKELNRRKIGSINATGSLSYYMTSPAIQIEGEDSYLDVEQLTFLGALRKRINRLLLGSKIAYNGLPDDEGELMKLIDEEEDRMIGVDRNLKLLEKYELVSGHATHWIFSAPTDPYGLKAFWSWLEHGAVRPG